MVINDKYTLIFEGEILEHSATSQEPKYKFLGNVDIKPTEQPSFTMDHFLNFPELETEEKILLHAAWYDMT